MKRILLPACLLFALASAVRAQVAMRVEVGFDQNHKAGCWTPVLVELENLGRSADGHITIETRELQGMNAATVTYSTPFELPSGSSRKRYILYAKLRDITPRVVVSVVSGRHLLAEQEVQVRPANAADRILLCADKNPGRLNFLTGIKLPNRPSSPPSYPGAPPPNPGEVRVWNSEPDMLPDHWKGYDAVDVLALGSVSATALTGDQQRALSTWVYGGGTLVITGGVDWMRLRDIFYQELLPVEVTGSTQLNTLGSLARYCGSPISSVGTVIVPSARLKSGAFEIVSESGIPIIAEHTVGTGKVVYLAPDFALPPIAGWDGQKKIWENYLKNTAADEAILTWFRKENTSNYNPYPTPVNSLAHAVTNIPAMDVPSFGFIGLFLAAYIIVLVPVNYLVLKKKDKREYAWITIPIIVVVFSLAAYGIGYAIKGGQVLFNQASVVETTMGSTRAAALDFEGLFSPSRTSYEVTYKDRRDIASEAETQNQQARSLTIETGDTMGIRDFAIDMWSMRVLKAESVIDLGGEINAALSATASGVAGTISNNTDYNLNECSIIYNGAAASIGDLPSGTQDKKVDVSASGTLQVPSFIKNGTNAQKIAAAMVAEVMNPASGVLRQAHPILCGWVDKPAINPDINRRFVKREGVSLFLVRIPLTASSNTGIAPPGSSRAKVTYADPGWQGPKEAQGSLSGMLQSGGIEVTFSLPDALKNVPCKSLVVSCIADTNPAPAQPGQKASLEIWSWNKSQWQKIPMRNALNVRNPGRYVKAGQVRMRVENSTGVPVYINRMDIGFAGQ